MVGYYNNYGNQKKEHDLRHHLFTILGIIKSGDLQSAEMYLKKLTHEFETSIFKYIVIDNSAINSIINLKIGRCHTENIDIKVEIESDFNDYNDIDICVLLANLFDNAIEASSKVKEPYIEMTIKNEKNYLCIIVKNKIDNSVIERNKYLKTTKADKSKHGLGLYSISQIVEKYNGIKSYYEKNRALLNAQMYLPHRGILLEENNRNNRFTSSGNTRRTIAYR